jgi:hypothetical protein
VLVNSLDRKAILETTQHLLDDNPGPAVRVRLLRDVVKVRPDNLDLLNSIEELLRVPSVQLLSQGQMSDGGWGRFHSRATISRPITITTEIAINRSLALGLSSESHLIQRAIIYLRALLNQELIYPDPPEKNDRWSTAVSLFVGATLARIAPEDPSLEQFKKIWAEITRQTFKNGDYDADSEAKAHSELTGAPVKGSYLQLRNKYSLSLLGACSDILDIKIYDSLLSWLIELPIGVGYYDVSLKPKTTLHKPGELDRWFSSWELLAGMPRVEKYRHYALEWIGEQRNADGLWDFGARWRSSTFHPLSDSWRSGRGRIHDHSTRALLLLNMLYRKYPEHSQ